MGEDEDFDNSLLPAREDIKNDDKVGDIALVLLLLVPLPRSNFFFIFATVFTSIVFVLLRSVPDESMMAAGKSDTVDEVEEAGSEAESGGRFECDVYLPAGVQLLYAKEEDEAVVEVEIPLELEFGPAIEDRNINFLKGDSASFF